MLQGHVVHFNAARGFGKIRGDDRRQYFAHRDDLLDVCELRVGQRVEFEPVETVRGPRAEHVRPGLQAAAAVQPRGGG
jgi:cold shock CspA family protein